PVPKEIADASMDAAACIGCGACVAACKNASAMLFVAAKVSHLNLLPQGKAEKDRRAPSMVKQIDAQGVGNCTVSGSCQSRWPQGNQPELHCQVEPRLRFRDAQRQIHEHRQGLVEASWRPGGQRPKAKR